MVTPCVSDPLEPILTSLHGDYEQSAKNTIMCTFFSELQNPRKLDVTLMHALFFGTFFTFPDALSHLRALIFLDSGLC